jgi:RNA polymerase sigma-70 factor (ECF subfamily)
VAESQEITRFLLRVRNGDQEAQSRLYSLVYNEMRRMAHRQMARERADHTLQPTALVHEAFLKLVRCNVDWVGRTHFFAVAAQVMRRVLVDHARAIHAQKRGSALIRLELKDDIVYSEEKSEEMLALGDALDKLDRFSPRQSRVI